MSEGTKKKSSATTVTWYRGGTGRVFEPSNVLRTQPNSHKKRDKRMFIVVMSNRNRSIAHGTHVDRKSRRARPEEKSFQGKQLTRRRELENN